MYKDDGGKYVVVFFHPLRVNLQVSKVSLPLPLPASELFLFTTYFCTSFPNSFSFSYSYVRRDQFLYRVVHVTSHSEGKVHLPKSVSCGKLIWRVQRRVQKLVTVYKLSRRTTRCLSVLSFNVSNISLVLTDLHGLLQVKKFSSSFTQ